MVGAVPASRAHYRIVDAAPGFFIGQERLSYYRKASGRDPARDRLKINVGVYVSLLR
jgi:hypothetical protein